MLNYKRLQAIELQLYGLKKEKRLSEAQSLIEEAVQIIDVHDLLNNAITYWPLLGFARETDDKTYKLVKGRFLLSSLVGHGWRMKRALKAVRDLAKEWEDKELLENCLNKLMELKTSKGS